MLSAQHFDATAPERRGVVDVEGGTTSAPTIGLYSPVCKIQNVSKATFQIAIDTG